MDGMDHLRESAPMGRYPQKVYAKAATPRWIVVFSLRWRPIESQRLEPGADLAGAMAAAIERLAGEGWQIEAEPRFGFAFMQRYGERRLLMLTPRDPHLKRLQSFNPFRSVGDKAKRLLSGLPH
jgi:hypothetical protein